MDIETGVVPNLVTLQTAVETVVPKRCRDIPLVKAKCTRNAQLHCHAKFGDAEAPEAALAGFEAMCTQISASTW